MIIKYSVQEIIFTLLFVVALLIHPALGLFFIPFVFSYDRNSNYVFAVLLSISFASLVASREVYVEGVADDLIAYYHYLNHFPTLSILEFMSETRYEPVFYLAYFVYDGISPRGLLFANSFLCSVAYFCCFVTLAKKFNMPVKALILLSCCVFPFELVSNTPRQLTGSCLFFAFIFSRYRFISLLVHKSSIALIWFTNGLTLRLMFVSIMFVSIVFVFSYWSSVLNLIYVQIVKRFLYFFIQEPQVSMLPILMCLIGILVLIMEKNDLHVWRKFVFFAFVCCCLMLFGPLGIRLSMLIFPLFIVASLIFYTKLNAGEFNIYRDFSAFLILTSFLTARLLSGGAHEPFSGLGFFEIMFYV